MTIDRFFGPRGRFRRNATNLFEEKKRIKAKVDEKYPGNSLKIEIENKSGPFAFFAQPTENDELRWFLRKHAYEITKVDGVEKFTLKFIKVVAFLLDLFQPLPRTYIRTRKRRNTTSPRSEKNRIKNKINEKFPGNKATVTIKRRDGIFGITVHCTDDENLFRLLSEAAADEVLNVTKTEFIFRFQDVNAFMLELAEYTPEPSQCSMMLS